MPNSTITAKARRLTRDQRQLVRSLEKEFDTSFTAWVGNNNLEFTCIQGDASEINADVQALLTTFHDCDAPVTPPTDSGRTLLIVPLRAAYSDPAVAIAEVSGVEPAFLQPYATLLLEAEQLRRANRQHEEVNDSLTHAIAGCYEELIFLRDLATHLTLKTGTAATIRGLLPQLRTTLRVESLAMISNFLPGDEAHQTDGNMLLPEVTWSGTAILDDPRCLRLIREFNPDDDSEVAIQNDFHRHSLAAELPLIREFLLVRVGSAPASRWLLAINRVVDERAKRKIWRASEKELGTNEATLLTSAASFLATHFYNFDLLRQKEEMFTELVRALVNALEARDPYTRGHSERVARYARRLAEQIELDNEDCELIYLSGLLHDVGKVGVNDAILRKAGRLTDAEFRDISRHPDLGWEILHDLVHLRGVLPGVLYHHEQYDGHGYPRQLVGDKIPLEGRVLAICDAFDAMTSDRPYRAGMPQEQAEAILREGAGQQWDPGLIEAFFAVMPDILRIREECCAGAAIDSPQIPVRL